ncbi:MarR family winged helix-turn-helix transcriptional regulator [Nonomuraea sp. ATR24]|uniref:MarR family winged helix-turn-helix transcriptional regulator n=1 Tax=Nonomuraea sp. ATR24 TaxID=1676744 RepID=UPI0035C02822
MEDAVDVILGQWARACPGLDASPMGVVGRVSRLSRLLERGVKEFLAGRGLEPWEFDMLATLLRSGESHTMCMKDLSSSAMVSPGALTNRMDRLVERGLVDRRPAPGNRRMILVSLTPEGLRLVDDVLEGHLDNERDLLAGLDDDERAALAGLLRKLLVSLHDTDL